MSTVETALPAREEKLISDHQTSPPITGGFEFDTALSSEIKSNGKHSEEPKVPDRPLSAEMLDKMNRYWQAANYLTVGQIYLRENPLLREPLKSEHIKPRLLGHWGTSTGQNFLYVHLNRLIKEKSANIIYISGPGHGGPALNANSYLEGSYTEVRPEITPDVHGMRWRCPDDRDHCRFLAPPEACSRNQGAGCQRS